MGRSERHEGPRQEFQERYAWAPDDAGYHIKKLQQSSSNLLNLAISIYRSNNSCRPGQVPIPTTATPSSCTAVGPWAAPCLAIVPRRCGTTEDSREFSVSSPSQVPPLYCDTQRTCSTSSISSIKRSALSLPLTFP